MGKLTDFIASHDAEDAATEQLLEETKAALVTARADDALDELEISKLRAHVAVLEQWKLEHTLPEPPAPEPSARFPGDPGRGKYIIGLAIGPRGRNSIAELKKTPQWNSKVKMIHDYASGGSKCLDHGSIKEISDAGMAVASQSFKMLGLKNPDGSNMSHIERWKYVNSGKNDSEIRLSARFCKTFAKLFIWLCLHHEPENNFTDAATQKEYRAAYRRVVKIFREEGVTNVAFAPIYMVPYTFESSRDFHDWHADWNGTSWEKDEMMDLFGMDVYNPLPGGSTDRSFKDMVVDKAEAITKKFGMPVRPKSTHEFGFGRTNADWVKYGNECVSVAKTHDVVSFTYWDSSADQDPPFPRYSLLDPKKAAGWQIIVDGAS